MKISILVCTLMIGGILFLDGFLDAAYKNPKYYKGKRWDLWHIFERLFSLVAISGWALIALSSIKEKENPVWLVLIWTLQVALQHKMVTSGILLLLVISSWAIWQWGMRTGGDHWPSMWVDYLKRLMSIFRKS